MIPPAARSKASDIFLDFLFSLMTSADRRLGRDGANQVMQHEWFNGIDWRNVRNAPAPYIPEVFIIFLYYFIDFSYHY